MVLNFSDCDTLIEKMLFSSGGLAIIILLISASIVFSNENEEGKSRPLVRELTRAFEFIFTDQYLTDLGKRWRVCLNAALLYLLILIGIFNFVEGFCKPVV